MGLLAQSSAWLRQIWRRSPPPPDETLRIVPPVQRFPKLPPAEAEAMRARAEQRRTVAAARYRRRPYDDPA